MNPLCTRQASLVLLVWLSLFSDSSKAQWQPGALRDKTLVAWVSLDNLSQRGGSALTLDDGDSHFDGIVFGELSPRKWMAGSDFYNRTWKEQSTWQEEPAASNEFVQVAIVYRGKQVTLYRNGELYAQYTMSNSPVSFEPRCVVVFGRRHLDVAEPRQSFAGKIKDARIYEQALDEAQIKSLVPSQPSTDLKLWAWWSFADEGFREKTGRFDQVKWTGDVHIAGGCLVLPGNGASVFAYSSGSESNSVPVPKTWAADSPVPDEVVRSTRLLRERLLADTYRPAYHFCVPEDMGEPGDPNGAFYYKGRYHLMYLYNRNGAGFSWGHISSADLVHWRHHPDAIGPGHGDEGCFSGGAFVDDDGTAYLSYWMLWGNKGIGLARSRGPNFDSWAKFDENPVIKSTEWGVTETHDEHGKPLLLGSADPSNIWKHNGRYYVLTGNLLVLNKVGRAADAPQSQQGDRLYLFESTDLTHWKYLHMFYERNPEWTDRSEDDMCPSFLPLPSRPDGGPASNKHLLLFISHNKGCQYYIGDYHNDHFYPDNHGRMTWVDNTYFAPEALIDGKGRQIMWAWLVDNPPGEKAKGWSGVYGLPRSLWLGHDGTLEMAPVKELETLRGPELSWKPFSLSEGQSRKLEGFSGNACELQAEIKMSAEGDYGFKLRASSDGLEETLIYYDGEKRQLVFDATRSGPVGRKVIERAPLVLKRGEALRLRVFVDRSVIEVFANERQAISRRVYPSREDSLGISLFAKGPPASFKNVKAWEMAPANPY
jgi:beta-fructofuranosidase